MQTTNNKNFPFISVVVCTYNRLDLLTSCINSIYSQDYPKSHFELIIIDGGSIDGTKELCKKFPQMRFVIERKFGLAYARNKGAELARGSIVAFTDDDCIVDKSWLMCLASGFTKSENIVGVGGPVYPLSPNLIPAKIHVNAALGLFYEGNEKKLTDGLITSNVAFKKEIFETIRFNEKLGVTRRGRLVLSGEDTEFCQKIHDSGYNLLYVPCSKVYHKIHRDRIRVSYMIKRALHSGITKTRINLNQKQSRIWAIRYSLTQLLQSISKLPFDLSFTSCYQLIYCMSTVLVSITGLDRIV